VQSFAQRVRMTSSADLERRGCRSKMLIVLRPGCGLRRAQGSDDPAK
jgi:hypothetical protein